MTDFSDTPPTEAGLYLVLYFGNNKWEVAMLTTSGIWFGLGNENPIDFMSPEYRGSQFGPRVPTPTELAELRRDAERFRTCERLAGRNMAVDMETWNVSIKGCSTFTAAVDAAKETP